MTNRTPAVEAAIKDLVDFLEYTDRCYQSHQMYDKWDINRLRILKDNLSQLEQSTPTYAQGFREGMEAAAVAAENTVVWKYEDRWARDHEIYGEEAAKAIRAIPVPTPSGSQGWLPITNVDPNAHLAGRFCRYMVHVTLCSGKYGRELDIDIQGNIAGASVIEYAMEMITDECDEEGYMILTDDEGNTLGIEGDDIGEYVTQAIITSVESFPSYDAMKSAPQVKGVVDGR